MDGWPSSEAVVVAGVPGCGKTSFGQGLARRFHWAYLDLDTVTNPLYELAGGEFTIDVPTADPPSPPSVNDLRYRCLLDTAAENLQLGTNVVLVAPFTAERTFASRWNDMLARLRVDPDRVMLAWVDTPTEEVLRRMTERGSERDRDKLANPHKYFTPHDLAPPVVAHLRVDGLLPVSEQVEAFTTALVLAGRPPRHRQLRANA